MHQMDLQVVLLASDQMFRGGMHMELTQLELMCLVVPVNKDKVAIGQLSLHGVIVHPIVQLASFVGAHPHHDFHVIGNTKEGGIRRVWFSQVNRGLPRAFSSPTLAHGPICSTLSVIILFKAQT
jgi:hypothetical protein